MNRRKITGIVALASTFLALLGSQSAQAAIVGNASYVLRQASDWVVSLDITPDGRYVFVSNYTNGSLSRFDTTDSSVTTATAGGNPYGVAVSPDGTKVAVACSGSNAVVYLDVATMNAQITPGGNAPIAVAYNHAGTKLYSASEMDDVFREINASSVFSVRTMPLSGSGWQAPFYITVSADDTKAYVSNIVASTVTEVDLTSLSVVRTFTGFNAPLGLAVSADGEGLWVANSAPSANTVQYVDLGTGTVTASVTVGNGPREIALSPDGSQLAVANGAESSISLIDTENRVVTSTQTVGDASTSSNGNISGPWGIKYSPDGSKLYVANEYNGTLQAFTLDPALAAEPRNTSSGAVEKLANTGGPNWMSLGALGVLLSVAGALTLSATRRRTR
jgi:YVTN family beta-propeller protein